MSDVSIEIDWVTAAMEIAGLIAAIEIAGLTAAIGIADVCMCCLCSLLVLLTSCAHTLYLCNITMLRLTRYPINKKGFSPNNKKVATTMWSCNVLHDLRHAHLRQSHFKVATTMWSCNVYIQLHDLRHVHLQQSHFFFPYFASRHSFCLPPRVYQPPDVPVEFGARHDVFPFHLDGPPFLEGVGPRCAHGTAKCLLNIASAL